MIIVVAGPPCSGKSTLGDLLASRRGILHLEMDAVRIRLLPASAHTRQDRAVAYRAMHFAAELLAACGASVIVNACYGRAEDRSDLEEAAGRAGASLFLIQCTVPPEIAVERSSQRWGKHPGVDLTPERVIELVSSYPFSSAGVTVDSTLPIDTALAKVEEYLTTGSPLGAATPKQTWSRSAC
jgi:predicted kinase